MAVLIQACSSGVLAGFLLDCRPRPLNSGIERYLQVATGPSHPRPSCGDFAVVGK
jgi:hypothetical protein